MMKTAVLDYRPLPTPDFSGFLGRVANRLAEEMRERAPVRTSRLRDSIQVVRMGRVRLVGPTVPYAPYVEFGTRPHIIRPRRARTLRFEVKGRSSSCTPGIQGSGGVSSSAVA